MCSLSLPLSLILLFPVFAAASGDGHPDGHLGKTWEIAVGVSLGLLLFGAAATIFIVTIRQRRRRKLGQSGQSDFTYASHPRFSSSPSMPYGISRPSSVYQPRDKHGRKGSPDRTSRLKESV